MLIISRRAGESIILNDKEVVITVIEVGSNQVRIGVDAASDISINREEVYLRIKNGTSEKTGERTCVIQQSRLLTPEQK